MDQFIFFGNAFALIVRLGAKKGSEFKLQLVFRRASRSGQTKV
jgi:hypothetical protein